MIEYTPISVMSYKGPYVGIEEALNQGIFRNGDTICVGRDTYVFIDDGFVKLSGDEPCAASSGTQTESSTLTYKIYINALRKCAKEHENDRTSTGHIVVTTLCQDIANLLEELEQEPRKITLEDVKGYCEPRCLTIISNELLYELTHPKIKSLEQDPRWIPVSERLPEIHNYMQEYIVTIKGDFIRTAFFTETNGKSWWSIDNVIAWMPLLKAYREVEE